MIMEPKQTTHYNYFAIFLLLCSYYITEMIQKLEFHLLVVIILWNIEFGHTKINAENSLYQVLKVDLRSFALDF